MSESVSNHTFTLQDFSRRCRTNESYRNEMRMLLVANNKMPIVTASMLDVCSRDDNTSCAQVCGRSIVTRLLLLGGLGILSAVSALTFLAGVRLAYPNPREHLPDYIPYGPRIVKLLWCNEPDPDPFSNFFKYPVSLLIWCNKHLGIPLAVVTALLLMATMYLRHPMYDDVYLQGDHSRSNPSQRVKIQRNITLLVIGWFACINFILLSIFDILVLPWHDIFTITCFMSFIIYELAHNYYLAFDIWRNSPYACNEDSNNTASWHYAMLSIFALSIGVLSNVLTVCGFLLRGKYGPPFQWMTILAILCYFFPVYLSIVIRDFILFRNT